MVVGLNKVIVIGQVGRAPEMRFVPSGRAVTSFSVSVTRDWVDLDGGQHDETEWFNVVVWDALADLCKQRLVRGSTVYIEGQLHTRTWEDENGTSCFCVELMAQDVVPLCEPGGDEGTAG